MHIFFWIILWLGLTAKRRWNFKLPPLDYQPTMMAGGAAQPLLMSPRPSRHNAHIGGHGENGNGGGGEETIYWPKLTPSSPKLKVTFNDVPSTLSDNNLAEQDGKRYAQTNTHKTHILHVKHQYFCKEITCFYAKLCSFVRFVSVCHLLIISTRFRLWEIHLWCCTIQFLFLCGPEAEESIILLTSYFILCLPFLGIVSLARFRYTVAICIAWIRYGTFYFWLFLCASVQFVQTFEWSMSSIIIVHQIIERLLTIHLIYTTFYSYESNYLFVVSFEFHHFCVARFASANCIRRYACFVVFIQLHQINYLIQL